LGGGGGECCPATARAQKVWGCMQEQSAGAHQQAHSTFVAECPGAKLWPVQPVCVCVYYCRTYYKAVRGGGRRRVDDMCYDRRRAEACVDESWVTVGCTIAILEGVVCWMGWSGV